MTRSPLAPDGFPAVPPIRGVQFSTANSGGKYRGRDDVLLVALDPGTAAAGVFTRSRTASAAVEWCRAAIRSGQGRGLLANAGNANAFTGQGGVLAVERCAAAAAQSLACRPQEVYLASTGVIGEPLDPRGIVERVAEMGARLGGNSWLEAAQAIGTTDTFPKGAFRMSRIGEREVRIGGVTKGSGMVAPDMATVFAFVFTDASIPASVLQTALVEANECSYNCITVDSDTSTSDTNLLFATQKVEHPEVLTVESHAFQQFRADLKSLMTDLATQIVRDGEGATKLVTLTVYGAESDRSARQIAMAVANSPLVKTAIAGEDPNWGRIVMAIGKAGEPANRDRLGIRFGSHAVAEGGQRSRLYSEPALKEYMRAKELEIAIDAGTGGSGRATVWTCDLTHGYISINAEYRS